jgi:hypothetical protein
MGEKSDPEPSRARRRAAPDPRAFYVVWSPEGGDPVVKFPTFGAVWGVAWKLSEKYPGQSFFVLRSCWGRPARTTETPVAEGETPGDGGPADATATGRVRMASTGSGRSFATGRPCRS